MSLADGYKKNIGLMLLLFTLCFGTKLVGMNSQVREEPQFKREQKTVILIHGLMRTTLSMSQLHYFLKRQGYQVYSYSYPSAKNSIHEHAQYLHQFIQSIMIKYPQDQFYIITHSLGGIIAREALSQLPQKELQKIAGLIMLAPPNQGSTLAKFSMKVFPLVSYFVKPLAELSSEKTSYVHQVPIPPVKIGIIAGRYDAKVPPSAARLKGQKEPIIVNSTHTFIMNNNQTKQLIMHFLEKGSLTDTI